MRKISHKLIASYLGMILITFLVFSFIFTNYYKDYNRQTIQKELKDQSLSVVQTVDVFLHNTDLGLDDPLLEQYMSTLRNSSGIRITMIDSEGIVWLETDRNKDSMDNHLTRLEFQEAADEGLGIETRRSTSMGDDYLYVARPVYDQGEIKAYVRLSITLAGAQMLPSAIANLLQISMLVASLIALLMAAYFSRYISKPILSMVAVTQKIQSGDYDSKLYPQTRDEIGLLARGINQMNLSLKATMNRLLKAQDELESILNNLSNGVVLLDSRGQVRAINQAACRLFQVEEKASIGMHHLQVLKSSVLDEGWGKLQQTKEVQHLSLEWIGEKRRYLEVVMIPVLDADKLSSTVISMYDITQIKLAETIRTEFVSNASHELKTPLTAIKGFTETLLDGDLQDQEMLRRFLGIIDKETTRLVRLAEDLLSLARLEKKTLRIDREPMSLKEAVDNIKEQFNSLLEENHLMLHVIWDNEIPLVMADGVWMNQVLVNLLENAIKYSGEGKNITIRGYHQEKENQVCIQIIDEGIGIPDADKERVFERFYRVNKNRSRDSGGTGLGLSIVRHVVEAHQGSLGIRDHVPRGTEIWFCIPVEEKHDENNI